MEALKTARSDLLREQHVIFAGMASHQESAWKGSQHTPEWLVVLQFRCTASSICCTARGKRRKVAFSALFGSTCRFLRCACIIQIKQSIDRGAAACLHIERAQKTNSLLQWYEFSSRYTAMHLRISHSRSEPSNLHASSD